MKKYIFAVVALVMCLGFVFAMEKENKKPLSGLRRLILTKKNKHSLDSDWDSLKDKVKQVVFLPTTLKKQCLTCDGGDRICLWDVEKGKTIRVIDCTFPITCIGLMKIDEEVCIVGYLGVQKIISIWRLKSGDLLKEIAWKVDGDITHIRSGKDGEIVLCTKKNMDCQKQENPFSEFSAIQKNVSSPYSFYTCNMSGLPAKTSCLDQNDMIEKVPVVDQKTNTAFWFARSVGGSLGIYNANSQLLFLVDSCEVVNDKFSKDVTIKCSYKIEEKQIQKYFVVPSTVFANLFGHKYLVNYNQGLWVGLE